MILLPDALVQVSQLLVLFPHNLLVLELEQLSLLLKIGDNLTQAFLEQVNLRLEQFNLLCFFKLALSVLLHRQTLMCQFVSSLVIVQLKLSVSVVQVSQFFILKFGFFTQSEVLDHNVPLDF